MKKLLNLTVIFCIIWLSACGTDSTNTADTASTAGSVGTIMNPVSKPSKLEVLLQSEGDSNDSSYQLSLANISLVDCRDESGDSLPCAQGVPAEGYTTSIYDGDLVDIAFGSVASVFPEELLDVDSSTHFSLIQFQTAYVQRKFSENDSSAAYQVSADLQGVSYRVCTSSRDYFSSEEMESYCGNSEARLGDYLVDMNGDGIFGFFGLENGVDIG